MTSLTFMLFSLGRVRPPKRSNRDSVPEAREIGPPSWSIALV